MPELMRTCPVCKTRVLPTTDGKCPACGRWNFVTDVRTPVTGTDPYETRPEVDLYPGAKLHWRLFSLLVGVLVFMMAIAYIRIARREPGADREAFDTAQRIISVPGGVVVSWMWLTSRQLARWLRLSGGWWNPFSILRESAGFFVDQGIRSNVLGPYPSAVPGWPKGILEQDDDV